MIKEPFEWDDLKAELNLLKHGISFDEASTIFGDTRSLTMEDPLHSVNEDRFVINGLSNYGRHLIVVHTFRDARIRIISARRARRREREKYEQRYRK